MKDLFKILTLISCTLLFVSCEEDDSDAPFIPEQIENTLTLSFDLHPSGIYGTNEFSSGVPYSVNVPAADNPLELTVATNRVGVTQNFSRVAVDNLDFPGSAETFTVQGSIDLTFPGASFDERATSILSAQVIGLRSLDTVIVRDAQGAIEDTTFVARGGDVNKYTSEVVNVSDAYDRVPLNDANELEVLLDWANPGENDLDGYIVDAGTLAIIDGAETGTRYEAVQLGNEQPDSEYAVYTFVFAPDIAVTAEAIPYRIFYSLPNGDREVVEGVLPAGTEANTFIELDTFTKAGSNYTR